MNLTPTLKNLFTRAVSGAILVIVLLASVLFNIHTKHGILLVLALFSIFELLKLLQSNQFKPLICYTIFQSVVLAVLFYAEQFDVVSVPLSWALIPLLLCRFTYEIFRNVDNPLQNIALEIFSLIYILAPMLMLSQLSGELVAALLLMVWSNDCGAYIIGVVFGKHKLWPEVSPKKSWEGFWGGFILTIIVATLMGYYYFNHSPYQWVLIGGCVSLAAVMGDFFESLIKRKLGVKDSGDVIPGHGGFLDRFDALFFAAPIFYLIISLIHTFNLDVF